MNPTSDIRSVEHEAAELYCQRTIGFGGAISYGVIPLSHLEPGDQVRVGIQKGTLEKATFELSNGNVIVYEPVKGTT